MNSWLTKFVQEVAKPSKERYSPRTLYGIVAGIRRFLAEEKPGADVNPMSTSDKRYELVISFNQSTCIVFELAVEVVGSATMNFLSIFQVCYFPNSA